MTVTKSRRAEHFAEVSQLVHTFFRALDEKDDRLAAEAFAPNGTWMRQGTLLTGPNGIEKVLAERDPKRRSIHVITNLVVNETEESMLVANYLLTAYVGSDEDGMSLAAILDCHDKLELTDAGPRILEKTSKKLF